MRVFSRWTPIRQARPARAPARLCLLALLAGCAAAPGPAPSCDPLPPDTLPLYLVDRGWHTEIGIPAADLTGPLAYFRQVFPGARTILFGYGKKTFFTAPTSSPEEYLIGPFPGPAVIQVFALTVAPPQAYAPGTVVTLPLPPAGMARLSAFIGDDLVPGQRTMGQRTMGQGTMGQGTSGQGTSGQGTLGQGTLRQETPGREERPRLVAVGHLPESLFYAARSRYTLFHTCNGWVEQALRQAGLPIPDGRAIFAGQVMRKGRQAARRLCPLPPPPPDGAR